MNLIINASKAIGEQEGVIHVSTEQVTLLKQEHIRLEVSDTGCGITAEAQARMFDPFFRPRFAGRGLGLAVVQRIVHSHNGAIHLRSAPGQGATFEILLPSNGEPAPKNTTIPVPASHVRRSGAKAPTILLVEDEDTLRLSVSKMLCARGFSVIQARDGSAAIDLVRSHKVDIDGILLDVTLPGASSRAVFEEARRLRPKVKPIVTSAYNEKMAMTSIEAPQGGRFIRKPYQIDDLVRLLWEALGTG
jgi:CheY-like chemotaxis protein